MIAFLCVERKHDLKQTKYLINIFKEKFWAQNQKMVSENIKLFRRAILNFKQLYSIFIRNVN